MTGVADTFSIMWAEDLGTLPLCDVPWFGRAVVLSTGQVHFCCFSDAVVGNVLENSFEEVWQGELMQRIRATLANGDLPPECKSPSCPVYRDSETGTLVPIIQRLPHDMAGHLDPEAKKYRELLVASELRVEPRQVRAGDVVRIATQVRIADRSIHADYYLAVRYPDMSLHFLPHGTELPLPYAQNCLTQEDKELTIELPITEATAPGSYSVGVLPFAPIPPPGFVQNCYWADRGTFMVVSP